MCEKKFINVFLSASSFYPQTVNTLVDTSKVTSSYFIKQKCYWCTSFQIFFVSGFTHPNDKTYFNLPIFSPKYVQICAPVKYFFKIIFALWRSVAQAVYKAFFCHSMTELSVSFFVKFGLCKLSQLTLTYFLPSALDIQKPIRQFTFLEKWQHKNITTLQRHRSSFFSWIWTVQSFFVKVVRCAWDISKTESTLLFCFFTYLDIKNQWPGS